ncbi:helix-turn-helix domain-containing protein [Flavobacteriaceae bacterium R38]|nr:helix-turn-helix domain-containing protein [Flavobacteriaceae bacterium R38]
MDSSLVFNIFIAFGAFQALFISFIILSQRNKSLPKVFFSLFLIIEGITLIERLLAESDLIYAVPHLLGISYPISFLKPPLLFLMTLAIVNTKFKLRKIHSLHLIPFFIILLFNIPFYFLNASQKLEFVQAFLTKEITYLSFDFFLSLSFFFHIGIYIMACVITLKRFKTHVKNNKLVNWNLSVLVLYSIFLITHFIYFVIQPSGILSIPQFNTISMLIMTFVIQSVAYSFITRSNIFNNKNTIDLSNVQKLVEDEKLIRNKLENEKVYLDDALNIDAFSKSLSLPKKYVSDLINQRFGYSFKDLINQYRVKEAKKIMEKEVHSKIQLIDIAFESGFNNKVSFYRAFKRYTDKSPSEYFNNLKNDASIIKTSS